MFLAFLAKRIDTTSAIKLTVTCVASIPKKREAGDNLFTTEGLDNYLENNFDGGNTQFINIDNNTCIYFKAV